MAENRAVWGIDIGQAGLKAIRLRYAEAAEQVLAVAFDYVPHPKILSQPDAIPEELIPQALEKFLSRNETKGDAVAISVPGQTALTRFIQLPPVETSKISEIVKYEARQQIPFALEEVIWDFQTLGGGIEESGFMLEAEVGLFAMKRDQVMQQLKPYSDAKVEVELIQAAPLALFNYLSYDQLGVRIDEESAAAEEHTILVDMGADNTTLVVTNGQKIWIRNVPIGGNHFTRALTKEMKLTFAKAEHLKCNATKSPDPRAVFQALRPVFNDYVSEIQRSIGYFSSVNRDAKITRVLGLGNGFKLAGLQKFLQQNLQYEVQRVETFDGLAGDAVLNAPLFQENILSFAVPYGLALQGLGLTRIHTSLLPPEIATARKIREKKPWAVVTAASLLFGLALSAAGAANVYQSVSEVRFGAAEATVQQLDTTVGDWKSAYNSAKTEFRNIKSKGDELIKPLSEREYWPEVYRAINECLPRAKGDEQDIDDPQQRERINVKSITTAQFDDLGVWFNSLNEGQKGYMSQEDRNSPPQGAGYVFTLRCEHHHFGERVQTEQSIGYILHTILPNLQSWTVQQEDSYPPVGVRQIGITHPTVIERSTYTVLYNRDGRPRRTGNQPGRPSRLTRPGGFPPSLARPGVPGDRDENTVEIEETTFVIEFVWKKTPPETRSADPAQVAAARKP